MKVRDQLRSFWYRWIGDWVRSIAGLDAVGRGIAIPTASLARLAAGSSIGLTNTWRCMCSFELLMMDGKPV